jgi:alpha-L-fucosidase
VVLGHAFLQPGAWGRFKGLPVRKDVVEGMLGQGLTALRYGGSMVNGSDEYRWKKMVGPRDRRPPYGGTWYEYSSNGWGILDFIDLCEAAQFACVPCFNTGESAQDMADFVEYVNGPADSEWGRKRAEAGHPEPYRLKYLQLGNEQHVDGAYYEAFTRLAGAIWKRDPGITLIVGVHWDPDKSIDQHAEHYRRVIEFARDRNQTVWFDVHVWNDKPHEPDLTAFDRFVGRLAGFGMDNYRICVLEENAGNHSMKRALGHARALNLFQRSKLGIPILCAANGLQPDDQNDNGWNQGMLFLNPSQVWLQPPGYVTQMVSRNYQPLCVSARVDGPESPLDVTATRSEDGGTLVLQVLNASGDPVPARIVIDGFTPAGPAAEAVQLVGRPDDTNTAEESARIVPETKPDALRLRDGNADYTFPGGSFTILRFRGSAGAAQPSASAGKVPAKSAEWAKQINKTKLPDEVRAQQVKDLKFGMFICWSFSTFYGEEWTPTTGKDASFFKATGCDTDQWCKTAKEAGMNYILFLTKHHDGFCLWDTDTTDKKVTNSPLGIDVLAKLKDSCDRHGIKLALYFSDGDWMWPKAKDGQYMAGGEDPEMKKAQLKELLTRYGPIEYFWLDTAVGVGGLDRKPTIDWIHEFQPNAFVGYPHKGMGPRMTMREMGRPGPFDAVEKERGYLVAEFTYPILPPHKGGANWFYSLPEHDNLCKKAGDLYKDYQEGVKHGNVFALNVGPDYAGRLRDIDVRTLREIGEMIRTNAP